MDIWKIGSRFVYITKYTIVEHFNNGTDEEFIEKTGIQLNYCINGLVPFICTFIKHFMIKNKNNKIDWIKKCPYPKFIREKNTEILIDIVIIDDKFNVTIGDKSYDQNWAKKIDNDNHVYCHWDNECPAVGPATIPLSYDGILIYIKDDNVVYIHENSYIDVKYAKQPPWVPIAKSDDYIICHKSTSNHGHGCTGFGLVIGWI